MSWLTLPPTEVFDQAITAALQAGVSGNELTIFAEKMINMLELYQWDTQSESEYYSEPKSVQQAFVNLHPQWFSTK